MSNYNLDYIINFNSFIKSVSYYEEVGSTNDVAKELLKKSSFPINDFLILSDSQTKGRGKCGAHYFSPAKVGIYMSIVLIKPHCDLKLISIATSLAILKSIQALVTSDVKIKWPNDILINNKKVCGILIEASVQQRIRSAQNVIIGVGININNDNFAPEIESTATSLKKECGQIIDRNLVVVQILNSLKMLLLKDSKEMFNDYLANLEEKSLSKMSPYNVF